MSVTTLNEYVEPVTELFSKYSKGNIYFSSFEDSNHKRTEIELAIEGEIEHSEFEYIAIGVKLLKYLDTNIEMNIDTISQEKLNNYFDNSYEPIKIDSIIIYPDNTKATLIDDYSNILLKPGLGFGTGKHPTTKLCLQELQKIDNKVVLDIGTGSGILSIAATFYGATKCFGIDSDDMALNNASYNSSINELDEKIELIKTNFEDYTTNDLFDSIYANVSGSFLIENSDKIFDLLNFQGNLIISGFKEEDEKTITNHFSQFFNVLSQKSEDGWSCIRMVKK